MYYDHPYSIEIPLEVQINQIKRNKSNELTNHKFL